MTRDIVEKESISKGSEKIEIFICNGNIYLPDFLILNFEYAIHPDLFGG